MLPNPPDSPDADPAADERLREPPPATRVLRQFRIVFNAVKSHFRNVEKAAGIGGAQVWALSVLAQHPGIGVGELAKALDIHQTTASNLVKTLAAQGLVESGKSEHDRRAVALRLSVAGAERLAKAPAPFAGVLPGALASMDEQALARLEQDLHVLIEILQAEDSGANTPLADL